MKERNKAEKTTERTGNLKMEHLIPLHHKLEELMEFVQTWKWQHEEALELYHFLDYMKNNIELFLLTMSDQKQDLRCLEAILLRDWNGVFEIHADLASCITLKKNNRDLKLQYFTLLDAVDRYFRPGQGVLDSHCENRKAGSSL